MRLREREHPEVATKHNCTVHVCKVISELPVHSFMKDQTVTSSIVKNHLQESCQIFRVTSVHFSRVNFCENSYMFCIRKKLEINDIFKIITNGFWANNFNFIVCVYAFSKNIRIYRSLPHKVKFNCQSILFAWNNLVILTYLCLITDINWQSLKQKLLKISYQQVRWNCIFF